MELGEKIGTGRFRDCFATTEPHLCAKKIKPLVLEVRSIIAHLLRDINEEEIEIYRSIPPALKDFFPAICYKDGELLILERPIDFDGSYSKTLIDYDKIADTQFWDDIDTIAHIMRTHKLWFFDLFHMGNNILVQKISPDKFKPVFIDCKRLGRAAYPLQFNLLLDSEKEKKFLRRLERFKQRFSST